MKICVPVMNDLGLESLVSAHFGSAPYFLITDTESGECDTQPNSNKHHAHGMCMPLQALGGRQFDAIVVGGIGMGALMKLQAGGKKVYHATGGTVAEVVDAVKVGTLIEVNPQTACGGHGPRGGCGH